MKRFFAVALVLGALAIPAAAVADSCANVSHAPAPCGMTCTAPVVDGNWVWLPSVGVSFPAWGFAPPGTADSVGPPALPGANGNYTNGYTSSLLGHSALCPPDNGSTAQSVRQQDHGIQSGCE